MKSIVFALTFLSLLAAGSALQCFVCNSQTDIACSDEFRPESPALQNAFLQECENTTETSEPFCRKLHMVVTSGNGTDRVQRDCAYQRRQLEEGYSCYSTRSEVWDMLTCQCDGEMCNGASNYALASILAVLVPLLTRFL